MCAALQNAKAARASRPGSAAFFFFWNALDFSALKSARLVAPFESGDKSPHSTLLNQSAADETLRACPSGGHRQKETNENDS
jgi:hypothetical protein